MERDPRRGGYQASKVLPADHEVRNAGISCGPARVLDGAGWMGDPDDERGPEGELSLYLVGADCFVACYHLSLADICLPFA